MNHNLAATYTLIHTFLIQHSHTKAAQAVKKAAKEVVILKDDIDIEGPQLDEIISQWKLLVTNKAPSGSTSESDSESSSSESSSSSSSSSSRQRKEVKTKDVKMKTSSSSSASDSDSDSDSKSDSDNPPNKTIQSKTKVSTPCVNSPSSESSSSSSDSGSESDDESEPSDPKLSKQKQNLDKKTKPNTDQKPQMERDSSRTLSSGNASKSSSEPESDDENEGKEPHKQESQTSTGSTSEFSTPRAQVQDEARVTKKRRMDMGGTAVAAATTSTVQREESRPVSTGRIKGSNGRPGRQVNERFQRVNPTKVEPIMDNRYVAKAAPTNDYGQRAHEALIVTRGDGFRKEKNKKKKGGYRGGEITMESHSFKFT